VVVGGDIDVGGSWILTAPQDPSAISRKKIPENGFSFWITHDALRFTWPKDSHSRNVVARLYAMSGRQVGQTKELPAGDGNFSVTNLSPGPYFIDLNDGGRRYTKAFAIVR
jgi:hypothetical protein